MSLFLTGLIAGLCVGAGGVGVYCLALVSRLFETHRQTVAQALSSERVLRPANDPARERPALQRPKTEMERALAEIRERERMERMMFGEE